MHEIYHQLIKTIGDDPGREGLLNTPARAAKAMGYLTEGYQTSLDDIINGAVFESDMDELVIVEGIEFYSLCEHHLLPFFGHVHIAYIPHGKVLGLSKFARIVDMFSRRLQIQEQLTNQIADAILTITKGLGCGVIVEAQHLCMMMRGVQKQRSTMTTSVMRGVFRDDNTTRTEFLNLLKRN